MSRRHFLLGAAALAAAPRARAQALGGIRTLGVLSFGQPRTSAKVAASPFGEKLAALGWAHGRNLRIEPAYAGGRLERLPGLAAGLVQKNVDAVWAISPPAAVAAARATRTIPIVFVRVVWPVELGLAQAFARPGGNATGVASIADPAILAKPSEHLREVVPGLDPLTVIAPASTIYQTVAGGTFTPTLGPELMAIMDGLGIAIRRHLVATDADIDAALADAVASRAGGLFVTSSPLLVAQAKRIVEFALRHRLPSAFIESHFVEAGACSPTARACGGRFSRASTTWTGSCVARGRRSSRSSFPRRWSS